MLKKEKNGQGLKNACLGGGRKVTDICGRVRLLPREDKEEGRVDGIVRRKRFYEQDIIKERTRGLECVCVCV